MMMMPSSRSMSTLRRVSPRAVKACVPRRDVEKKWHNLGEFTMTEADNAAFRDTRARDTVALNTITKYGTAEPEPIDWKRWEKEITHTELVSALRAFYTQNMQMLDDFAQEDHRKAVKDVCGTWEIFDEAVVSCEDSVKTSEQIVKNGARALYISFNNPPISHASTSEWLDADQYWQAFVEKHMYHANYLNALAEDPESAEYIKGIEETTMKQWHTWDDRGVTNHNNKYLYQRPSFEYYDLYRGPLVEHMIFYLTKTGGDARTFPELMPHQWFAEIYNNRFEMFSVLQRRRRAFQEASLSREAHLDLAPAHMDAEGEQYYHQFYERLLSRESSMVELSAARLMGNFIFLNDAAIPIQTQSALLRVVQEHPNGKFYSLGDDVNSLFYAPAGEVVDEEVCPVDAFNAYMDYMKLTGRRFNPGYNQALSIFYRTLESRKPGLEGRWFQVKGERQADAFLRRLRADDPHRPVYEEYVAELKERWSNKKELSEAEVMPKLLDVEYKYRRECIDFDTLVMSMNEEISSEVKEKAPEYEELMADDGMSHMMADGSIVAIDAESHQGLANQQQLFTRMTDFDASKDKFVENVNNTKTGLDTKRH